MRQVLSLACALTVSLVTAGRAQTTETPHWAEGTHVAIVGRVTSAPKSILGVAHEHKMQVAVGPRRSDYTLHLSNAQILNDSGREMAVSDLKSDWWVRATGTVMDDPRRIKVSRLEVLAPNQRDFERSTAFRQGFTSGYVMAVNEGNERRDGTERRDGNVGREERGENRGAPGAKLFSEGTPVVLVGEITRKPRDAGVIVENKMRVGVGPDRTDYTLHLSDAEMVGAQGQTLHKSDLRSRMWVRAEGMVMNDPRRIKVSRLQVIGRDRPDLQKSAFYRPGLEQGYVMAVAGSREIFPERATSRFSATPVTLVGRITDDTGPFNATRKISVRSAGNEWNLRVVDGASVLDDTGKQISVHDLKNGQWVRATGWQTDDLRLRAFRVEALRPSEMFERSTFYRRDDPNGYYERVTVTDQAPFRRSRMTGTVTAVNREFGYVTLRNDQGRTHRVYTDLADLQRDGRSVDADAIREGDQVTVSGYLPEFPSGGADR